VAEITVESERLVVPRVEQRDEEAGVDEDHRRL
jgi:hypothetical protein